MNPVWTRMSPRLWVTEVDGRHFRIQRTGMARQGGAANVREVDEQMRTVEDREVIVYDVLAGKRVVTSWIKGECFECHMSGVHKLDCSQPHKANVRREHKESLKRRALEPRSYN